MQVTELLGPHHVAHRGVLRECESLDASTWLRPTHVAWPMGFAWPSAVAQDATVATISSQLIFKLCLKPLRFFGRATTCRGQP